MKKSQKFAITSFIFLIVLDIFIWQIIVFARSSENPEFYFFNVGQGDSQLINIPRRGGVVKILIDGGKDAALLEELSKAMPRGDTYIDLVIMTHPQLDHFGGLIRVLEKYQIGAFISNGRKSLSDAYTGLVNTITRNKIPFVVLGEGDSIQYQDFILKILSPSVTNVISDELNDTSLVFQLTSPDLIALYTGDIGTNVESELIKKYDLKADILKVPHHGSRFSSSETFLNAVKPKISVIGVGKNNYGHPTKSALDRLENIGSLIYRTDLDGTIKIIFDEGKLNIYN